jgi:hypothetical protein
MGDQRTAQLEAELANLRTNLRNLADAYNQSNAMVTAHSAALREQEELVQELTKKANEFQERMSVEGAEYRSIIEEQKAELERLKHGTTQKRVKIGKLEKFGGDRSRLRAFLTGARRQMEVEGLTTASESDKVLYVSSFLEKDPEKWFEPFLREYQQRGKKRMSTLASEMFNDYAVFERHLDAVYGNVDAQRDAAQKIVALKQTGSAMKYCTIFNQHRSFLPWTEQAFMDVFMQGLKPEVMRGLVLKDEEYEDLAEMMEAATKIDNAEFEVRQIRKRNKPAATTHRRDREGDTVMSGAVNVAEAKKKGLCFKCGKKGHRANKCRSGGQGQQGQSRNDIGAGNQGTANPTQAAVQVQIASMSAFDENGHNSEAWYSADEGVSVLPTIKGTEDEIGELSEPEVPDAFTDEADRYEMEVTRQRLEVLELRMSEIERLQQNDRVEHHEETDEAEVHHDLSENPQPSRTLESRMIRRTELAASEEVLPEPPRYEEVVRQEPDGYPIATSDWLETAVTEMRRNRELARIRRGQLNNQLRISIDAEIAVCQCEGWKQECFVNSELTMGVHMNTCETCHEWMNRPCPIHTPEMKMNTFANVCSTRFAPSIKDRFNEAAWMEKACRTDAISDWYHCYTYRCMRHRRIKEAMRCFPLIPRVTFLNALQCPCLRPGCLCSRMDDGHVLHHLLHPQLCEVTRCRSHELDHEIQAELQVNLAVMTTQEDSQKPMKIKVKIEGQEYLALIDTGASKTMIGDHVLKNLEWGKTEKLEIVDYSGYVQVKQTRHAQGYYEIDEFQLQDMFYETEITSRTGYDIILGMDWLTKYRAIICCRDRTVILFRKGEDGKIERINLSSITVSDGKVGGTLAQRSRDGTANAETSIESRGAVIQSEDTQTPETQSRAQQSQVRLSTEQESD